MTKAMANTYPVKSGKIGAQHPAVSALMLSFSILLLGFPPVLLFMNAHSLQGLPFILLSLLYVVSVCTAYAFIVLNSQASKLKREIGKKALAELYPSLNRFEERKAAFLSAFGISPDWDYVPKSERKAFFVNTGYGVVKMRKIKVKRPVLITLELGFATVAVGIIPTLITINAQKLGWWFTILWAAFFALLVCIYIAICLPEVWRKERFIFGDEMFYSSHPRLKMLKERREQRALRIAEKAIMPKSERKAFFVYNGYGAVKLGKIKSGIPVLQAILVAIPMVIGIVVITPLIFCIEGPLFIVAVCGYLLFLFGVNIAVRLPSILRKEKELLGDEFYYFHPVLKRMKERKERIAARAAEKAEIMKNDKPIQGKIFAMNATLHSLLWVLGMGFSFFPIYFLIAYAEDLGRVLYPLLWGVYLGSMALAYGIIDARKRRRIERIYEEDAKNCERTESGDIHKFQ